MVSIQEEIAAHYQVSDSSVEVSEIEEFAKAIRGEIPYNSQALGIELWEDFILTWLNGGVYEEKEEYMKRLFHTFRDDFAFDGIIYRGMMKREGDSLHPLEVASYSTSNEVAYYFAGCSEDYGMVDEEENIENVVIHVDAEKAFAFDAFLKKLRQLTNSTELKEEINIRMWEEEKIYPLPAYTLCY